MALSFKELMGMSQASSGDYRHGLGVPPATVVHGHGDLEPGNYGYAQTTKPGMTVHGVSYGHVPPGRKIKITSMVSELEFLAGTPGIHPRVLAQKAWQARKALMGSARWDLASYASPRAAYDSYDDLVARLNSVERVLGIARLSPKIMSALYGMGGLGGLGAYTGSAWGEPFDPVSKLASCIRGVLCMPKAFCCDRGEQFEDPYEDYLFEDEEFPDFSSAGGNGGTWTPPPPPPKEETWVQPPPPKEETWVQPPPKETWVQPPPEPAIKVGGFQPVTPKPFVSVPRSYQPVASKPLVGGSGQAITPGVLVGGAGRPVTGVTRGLVTGGGGALAPTGGVAMGGLGGLGRRRPSPALARLIAQLRQARMQALRARSRRRR